MGLETECTLVPPRSLAVVVLLGGWSAERAVSLASGEAVIAALRTRGHDVCQLDPLEIDVLSYPWQAIDVAFNALHGTFGEDGTLQTLLDEMRVNYTGSGAAASRLAMSKSRSKWRFAERKLSTPSFTTIESGEEMPRVVHQAGKVGYPLVVKPDGQGSTIGVSIVDEPSMLPGAIAHARSYDPLVLLEKYVPGRELTVGVLDGEPLPVIEIQSPNGFFDYEAKYESATTRYVIEPDLGATPLRQVQRLAVAASASLGVSGVSRVDLRLDPAGKPWILEVNTVPGFTEQSLIPKAARHAGISMADLCERMIEAKAPAIPQDDAAQAA